MTVVVARDETTAGHLVFLWPNPLPWGAEVVCSEHEVAIICPNWEVGERLGPGRHAINQPSPPQSRIIAYFFNTAPQLVPFERYVAVPDRATGQLAPVRFFGSARVKIGNPVLMCHQVVGLPYHDLTTGIVRSVYLSLNQSFSRVLAKLALVNDSINHLANQSAVAQLVSLVTTTNPMAIAVTGMELINIETFGLVIGNNPPVVWPAPGNNAQQAAAAMERDHDLDAPTTLDNLALDSAEDIDILDTGPIGEESDDDDDLDLPTNHAHSNPFLPISEFVSESSGELSGEFSGERSGEFSGELSGEFSGEFSGELSGEFSGESSGEFETGGDEALTSTQPNKTATGARSNTPPAGIQVTPAPVPAADDDAPTFKMPIMKRPGTSPAGRPPASPALPPPERKPTTPPLAQSPMAPPPMAPPPMAPPPMAPPIGRTTLVPGGAPPPPVPMRSPTPPPGVRPPMHNPGMPPGIHGVPPQSHGHTPSVPPGVLGPPPPHAMPPVGNPNRVQPTIPGRHAPMAPGGHAPPMRPGGSIPPTMPGGRIQPMGPGIGHRPSNPGIMPHQPMHQPTPQSGGRRKTPPLGMPAQQQPRQIPGQYPIGSQVLVYWNDGLWHSATIRAFNGTAYQVSIDGRNAITWVQPSQMRRP